MQGAEVMQGHQAAATRASQVQASKQAKQESKQAKQASKQAKQASKQAKEKNGKSEWGGVCQWHHGLGKGIIQEKVGGGAWVKDLQDLLKGGPRASHRHALGTKALGMGRGHANPRPQGCSSLGREGREEWEQGIVFPRCPACEPSPLCCQGERGEEMAKKNPQKHVFFGNGQKVFDPLFTTLTKSNLIYIWQIIVN